jgi:hypothetical protein
MADRIYVKFLTADNEGQFTKGFSLAVKSVYWHGLTSDGMLWDLTHDDGTQERILVRAAPYGDFNVGRCPERIMGIQIVIWDQVITKEQYHERVGKGLFLHPKRGHFVDESELSK